MTTQKAIVKREWLLSIFSILALASAGQAQTPAQIQKTFQTYYNAQDVAFARNDPQGTTAYFANDFNGLARQRQDVKEIHQLASKSATAHTDIKHLTLNPARNAVDIVIQTRYVAVSVNPHSHKTMTIVISGVYQETWAKRPEGWRITEQRKISTHTTAA